MTDKKKQPRNSARKPDNQADAGGYIPPEDSLGERVLLLRTQKSLSHEGLSVLAKLADPSGVGISRTTIRGYELGNFKPGARELRILSNALQVSPSWLLLGDPQSQNKSVADEKNDGPSYGESVQIMAAFSALPAQEREALKTLAFSLLKYKIGEVDFRKTMGFSGDMGNIISEAYNNSGLIDGVVDVVDKQIAAWSQDKN